MRYLFCRWDQIMRRLFGVLLFALVLTGCTTETRSASVERTSGVQNGQPVELITVREERAKAETSADIGPLVNAAVSAAMGDVRGALKGVAEQVGALQARPVAPTEDALAKLLASQVSTAVSQADGGKVLGVDPEAAGAISIAMLLALREWAAHRATKKDSDEAWDKLTAKTPETKA